MNDQPALVTPDSGERLLEKHLQHYLATNLQTVFSNPGLLLEGTEIQTGAGRIDILGIEPGEKAWVIETKIGIATRDAVAQLQSYMSAITEVPRYQALGVVGILVAEDFDKQCEYALRTAKEIRRLKYSIAFEFSGFKSSDQVADYVPARTVEPWVVDLDRQVFHPKNDTRNEFTIFDRYRVADLLADRDIELRTKSFSVGTYRKIG
jgi:hypothetical protein